MPHFLLLMGGATAVIFVVVLLVEGAIRPGYRPRYHTGSELSLSDRGWIQIANFLMYGTGMLCFAVGVYRALGTPLGAALVAVHGLALIAAGVFVTDRRRGYPPGAVLGAIEKPTWHHQVHETTGPVAYFALFGASLVIARDLQGIWRLYTVVTATIGLGLLVGTALSYRRDASNTGLVQRALIIVYVVWIALMSIHLG